MRSGTSNGRCSDMDDAMMEVSVDSVGEKRADVKDNTIWLELKKKEGECASEVAVGGMKIK